VLALCVATLALHSAPLDLDDVRQNVSREVSLGYGTKPSLVRSAMIGLDPADEPKVAAVVDEVLRQQLAKQRAWKGKTDNDRLTAAFAALEKKGVLAREYFSMTTTWGRGEMKELAATMTPRPLGYVFFTPQDLNDVFTDKGLFLTFGADQLEAWASIGAQVVKALEKEGLHPEWSGSPTEKIWVPLVWRRRLPGS
jgi:cytochrome P450